MAQRLFYLTALHSYGMVLLQDLMMVESLSPFRSNVVFAYRFENGRSAYGGLQRYWAAIVYRKGSAAIHLPALSN